MPRPGGEADKLGNHYEAVWTVNAVLDVLEGFFRSITIEPHGEIAQGIEFILEKPDHSLEFHSLKRQKQGGDWSIADLCRPDKGRSILGDLIGKLGKYPSATIRFVSGTGANDLRELSETARRVPDLGTFRSALSAKLQTDFDTRIVPLLQNNAAQAFRALVSMEVVLRSHEDLRRGVDQRIERMLYSVDATPCDGSDIRRLIAEYVLIDRIGKASDKSVVLSKLREIGIGIRDWKSDPTVLDVISKRNSQYLDSIHREHINGHGLQRTTTDRIWHEMMEVNSKGVLLAASGGYGKSCVLAQSMLQLTKHNVPHLCIRMDDRTLCRTTKQLGKQLDLPASPAVVLAGIADGATCVLIVDQLDAISLVSGRNAGMYDVFHELWNEAKSYHNMHIIVACRDYDLTHDHRLRPLSDPRSGFNRIDLGKLEPLEIRKALDDGGLKEWKPNARQTDILGVPFHLSLFLQGRRSDNFGSVGELYDSFWERKRQNLSQRLGRLPNWNSIIDSLTRRMSQDQSTVAPMLVAEEWSDDARAMVSEHVLVEVSDRNGYRFFHESFFDYSFARRFCEQQHGLLDFLLATDQELFRRAQVRQILTYRRAHDFRSYLNDLQLLLTSDHIRFHIKRMVAVGLSQIIEPTAEEWTLIEPYVLSTDLSASVSSALRDHAGWFDVMSSLSVFHQWLTSGDPALIHAAFWFLQSRELQAVRSAPIAKLIAPYADPEEPEWRRRIFALLSWGFAYKSAEMIELFHKFHAQGGFDIAADQQSEQRDVWSCLHDVDKEAPIFLIDIIGTWFDRYCQQILKEGAEHDILSDRPNREHDGLPLVESVAASQPAYFLKIMLPRVIAAVTQTEYVNHGVIRNRLWPYFSNTTSPMSMTDAILIGIRRSLEHLSQHDEVEFRSIIATILVLPHQTFAYLLLHAWASNPQPYANDCADYLVADRHRLNIGYAWMIGGGEGTGESAVSRIALRAITPHCSKERLQLLEAAIHGYSDEYEMHIPRLRGYSELLVLRSIDRSRISQRTRLRIEELERKFPNLTDEIISEDHSSMAEFIGSPISDDKCRLMTDSNWISAMRKYNDPKDRYEGGPQELCIVLREHARQDRARFGQLPLQMTDEILPVYFSAVLEGLCGSFVNVSEQDKAAEAASFATTPTELFVRVIDRLHAVPGRPCGGAILDCIAKLASRKLPSRIYEIITHYAACDPDPTTELWQETVNGHAYYGGDVYTFGINTVRGKAAHAISALLFEDSGRLDPLRDALQAITTDSSTAVRACATNALLPILNINRDYSVDLLLQAISASVHIRGTAPYEKFITHAKFTHFEKLRPVLADSLSSDISNVVEIAARQIVLYTLGGIDVGGLIEVIHKGNVTMRKAAASVYSRFINHPTHGSQCIQGLECFLNDDSPEVLDRISNSFFQMPGDRLTQIVDFINHYVASRAFERDSYRLLHSLTESTLRLPHVVLVAAERLLEVANQPDVSPGRRDSLATREIAALVIRQYEQTHEIAMKTRCLDLLDRMEKKGFYGTAQELSRIER